MPAAASATGTVRLKRGQHPGEASRRPLSAGHTPGAAGDGRGNRRVLNRDGFQLWRALFWAAEGVL